MRLPIDTSRLRFLVVAPAEPLRQYEEGKPRDAWAPRTDANDEILWRVQLVVLGDGEADIIRVAVPGDPNVSQGEMARVEGMTAQAWEMEGRSGMAFRAQAVRSTGTRSTSGEKAAAYRGSIGARAGGAMIGSGRTSGRVEAHGPNTRSWRSDCWPGCGAPGSSSPSWAWRSWGQRLVAGVVGNLLAALVVAVVAATAVAVAPARRVARRMLRRSWVRRSWDRASDEAGTSDGLLRAPRVLSVTRIPAGDLLRVRVRRGQSVVALEARREELSASLRVREVRVQRDRSDAAIAHVTLMRRDPFDVAGPLSWLAVEEGDPSLWDQIPLGVDEHGRPVEIGLVERNVLVGGEPGAGQERRLVSAGRRGGARP